MTPPEEPHERALPTKLSQVHIVKELLPSAQDLLLLKAKMITNGFPSAKEPVLRPLADATEVVNEPVKSREAEKVVGFEDCSLNRRKEEIDRKDNFKLGSRTAIPLDQTPTPDSSLLSGPEESRNNFPRGRPNTREKHTLSGGFAMDPEEVRKLSPSGLGLDTPTSFPPHSSPQNQQSPLMTSPSLTSPTRNRSSTNPTTTSPITTKGPQFIRPRILTQERPLSAPPGPGRSRSFPRVPQLNIQTSPPRPPQTPQQRGRQMQKGGDIMSPQKITSIPKTSQSGVEDPSAHIVSPKSAASSSTHSNIQKRRDSSPPSSAHLLKAALPLQTYLSLALASPTTPTSHTSPSSFHSLQKSGSTPSANIHYPPQHHPDDSAAIAFERIINFFVLPGKLEGTLWFGMLACLDSWLYMFTILPLRFVRALGVLCAFWWGGIMSSLSWGSKSKLRRKRSSSSVGSENIGIDKSKTPTSAKPKRTKRVSDLQPSHKADILRGLVVFTSCWILMRFDASRMYHSIRGQNGIKLYVIYNMLEISDRLCSALGQDIFECLFSKETLERGPDGRSKILRPLGFFLLALAYNTLHSTALFYQVITLNVAVNSYSNALLTLLLSVQFVEIKSTVFKNFQKESLFQLTCADVVERFQLWLMLIIIASRNLVEVGVWSLSGVESSTSGGGGGILPKSFTIFPEWTGQVMGPFLLVLGSEMLVDWLKHAYITKFNNTRPAVYERFLDVLCKDYYTHAFEQNLTKRLGLPVIPLACLFIRASLQTYQMFLATHVPLPLPSATTALSESAMNASPVTTAALANFDAILRRAIGRPSFGGIIDPGSDSSSDSLMAAIMLLIFFLGFFLVFLAVKLVLGICLLSFAQRRKEGTKERARISYLTGARKVGGFGLIEVSDDQKKGIYLDDPVGERAMQERESRPPLREVDLDTVKRYSMAAKRIW